MMNQERTLREPAYPRTWLHVGSGLLNHLQSYKVNILEWHENHLLEVRNLDEEKKRLNDLCRVSHVSSTIWQSFDRELEGLNIKKQGKAAEANFILGHIETGVTEFFNLHTDILEDMGSGSLSRRLYVNKYLAGYRDVIEKLALCRLENVFLPPKDLTDAIAKHLRLK
ncbi:MAG: hypothetical protein H7Y42_13935 [Chitinophagaceae bacterium]|nr:hypothetical protein [Chitinophagaceae bacterium]